MAEGSDEISVTAAIGNAARILTNAEMETNLALMERLEKLADSWISVADLLARRERDRL
jgi:hypothetical protein